MNEVTRPNADELRQPSFNACTPTSFGYLVGLMKGEYPLRSINKVIKISIDNQYLTKDHGAKTIEMLQIATMMGMTAYQVQELPTNIPFVVGVKSLPKPKEFPVDELIQEAIYKGSLVIEDEKLIYPRGHAVCVTQLSEFDVNYFDPYLGKVVTCSRDNFTKGLNENPRFTVIQ